MKKRRLRSNLIALYSFLRRRWREGGADLFFLISSDETYGNSAELHQGKFTLEFRKHFFTKRLVKQISLPRGVVDAPGLSVLKTHLDKALNTVL